MPPSKYPPEAIADALARYARGERVATIQYVHQMPAATLYYHLDREARRSGQAPVRRRVVARAGAGREGAQSALARRLSLTAMRFVAAIDRRLTPGQDQAARARDLHALRLIGRLCRDIASLERRMPERGSSPTAEEEERERIRADDELRAQLAEQMDAMLASQDAADTAGESAAEPAPCSFGRPET